MDFSLFFDQVEKHFHYLVDKYGFSVVKKELSDHFDNTQIILESKECRIWVLRERGEVYVDIGPLSVPEESYDLTTLIAYLTKEAEQLTYKVPDYDDYDVRIEWQVERLAGILERYYIQICDLFREETFDRKRADLKEFIELRIKKRWNL